jgi:UDP-galactopyranose mutase
MYFKEENIMYDYLIVGAGLYGSVMAHELHKAGKSVLVVEQRDHIGGNCYTEKVGEINVHKYGAHIFHTDNEEVWNYINQFAKFNSFINSPKASYKGNLYSLPFNMHTFNEVWGVMTPEEAEQKIKSQIVPCDNPQNVEEQALATVGTDIYQMFIKGYTEKQWGVPCSLVPAEILQRIPIRYKYNNNYFNSKYQGIPIGGYTQIFDKLLDGIEVYTNCDFLNPILRPYLTSLAETIIFTGPIDAYYDYFFGNLGYRSISSETEILPGESFQNNAVVNYTTRDVPYTRVIEHKFFEGVKCPYTVISKEYTNSSGYPCYPIRNETNIERYNRYKALSKGDNVIFGGRLGEYMYYDMDKTIESALKKCGELLANK